MARLERTGAKSSRLSLQQRFKAYLGDHKRVCKESLQRLKQTPVANIMTWLVIGIALALPVGFYVAISNVQALSGRLDSSAQISLFLQQKANDQQIQRLQESLKSWPELAEVKLISKEQGLAEFQAMSGLADVLSHLQDNPLPVVLELTPHSDYSKPKQAEKLLEKLKPLPLVDVAQLDLQWVQRLNAMLILGQKMALGLVLLLSLGVLLIIGNTIRLEVENRREEIVVVKLVGGTDGFIRRPFLYTGMFFGLGGGIVASIIVSLGLAVLNAPVAKLAGLYQSDYRLLGMPLEDVLALWLMAALLGFFGAWLALNRHLDELEPQ